MKIKITKLEGKPVSALPIGYWVIGYIIRPLEVGKVAYLYGPIKTSLNERFDYFSTTEVKEVGDGFFLTKNSKWKLEELEHNVA